MLQNLEAYLQVNEIENSESLLAAGKVIVENLDKWFVHLARQGYILQWFYQLLQEDINLEQFMQLGDLYAEQPQQLDIPALWNEAQSYLETKLLLNNDELEGAIVCVEKNVVESRKLKDELEKKGSVLVIL